VSPPAATFVRADRLPPDPSSPARARTFVAEALRAADRQADAELAALLVSETVTNAVLHAGTDLEVCCRVVGEVVRIEVRDGSSILPGVRHYEDGAMTGRGLALVQALARDWGVDCHPAGKTVWFELGPVPAGPPAGAPPHPAPAATVEIRLLGLPVGLVRLTVQYGDSVLREVALLAATDGPDAGPALRAPQLDLTPILDPVDAAWEAGADVVDLEIDLPVGAAAGAAERMARIEEADRMARAGLLLSDPAPPEIGACRRWLFGQVAVQLDGGPATPWRAGTA
jgi:anti-sigma regulatory factor (Ser/Thr protein kinase)